MQKPIIPLTLAYMAGLLLGFGFTYFPYSICVLVALLLLTSGLFSWFERGAFERRFAIRYVIIAGSCLIGIAAYLQSAAWLPADHYTRLFPNEATTFSMTGRIASPLDRDAEKTAFVLDLRALDTTPVSGLARVNVRGPLTTLGYGDSIRVSGRLFEPVRYNNPAGFDYSAYLRRNGVYRVVGVKNAGSIKLLQSGSGIFRRIQDWRERIRQAFLTSTSGQGSALLQAMVLGEEGALTDDTRDRFMTAGVTHIISISGSHLGMVAVLCFGFVKTVLHLLPERHYHRLTIHADPKKIAAGLTIPLLVFYTLLAGGQAATVRALLMISAALAALMLDREHALMHALALAALIILTANPQALFDISFQLSYLSVLTIASIVLLWNDLLVPSRSRLQRLRNSAALLIAISTGAALATGPLVAHYFNQVSLAGLVSNMVVVPFAGFIVVPLGLVSGLMSLATGSLPMAAINQLVADLFLEAIFFFSRLPFAQFHPPAPGTLWLSLYALFLLTAFGLVKGRLLYRFKPFESSARISKSRLIIAATALIILLSSFAPFLLPRGRTSVRFPDVGQGDCALIALASGKNILIDGGGVYDDRFDTGRRIVSPYLRNLGVHTLDLVVLSHPHPDHMNGLKYILKTFHVREIWSHGLDKDLPGYDEFERLIADQQVPHRVVSAADPPMALAEADIQLLHPLPGFRAAGRKAYAVENSRSLVVRITIQGRVFIFSGDIGKDAENDLLRSGKNLACDLLKVPHHGSKSSSSNDFIARTRPMVGIMTVGNGNRYHHPSPEVVAGYQAAGTKLYRTDSDGALTVTIENNGLRVAPWKIGVMREINLERGGLWTMRERENLRALWFRATEL